MQNVATRRRDRINSDEEERFRLGYELKTGLRFARRGGVVSARQATLMSEQGEELATLVYGHAATLWRMNLGWRRRKDKDQKGYVLDIERGYWARNQTVDDDPEDPLSPRTERVVPYVEDTRNCILVRPTGDLELSEMASLEAAIKRAIQATFQLEDRELSTESLPSSDERYQILLYEAAEGGAGVLRQLVEDSAALPNVARTALDLCHFDPESVEDRGRAPGARESCEAACYDCLLSYYNQRDHRFLDRKLLPDLLTSWMNGSIRTSPAPVPRENQLTRLLNLCQSELERKWVRMVDRSSLKLPSDAQHLIEACGVRPDFLYRPEGAAIFVDGPHHDTEEQRTTDARQRDSLEDFGLTVIRFHHGDDWQPIFRRYPSLFGTPSFPADDGRPVPGGPTDDFDPEDFDEAWRALMSALHNSDGVTVEPGDEVMCEGRALDLDLATVRRGQQVVRLVDDAQPTATEVATALTEQGHQVLRVRADEDGLLERILSAVGA